MLIVLVTFDVPLHSSVAPVSDPELPAKTNPLVVVPDLALDKLLLAVFKSEVSAQLAPFHSSASAEFDGAAPPTANDAVLVPNPVKLLLAVFKSLTSVQLVPLNDSVIAENHGSN